MSLLDLLDDWTDQREWVILGSWHLCGLCGAKTGMNQGGSRTGVVCDACAMIDSCAIRPHEAVISRRWDRSLPRTRHVAECLHCGWWLDEQEWRDGAYVPRTVAEVAERMLEHVRPRHTSHWGESHEIDAHDELVRKQAARRAAYWARHPES